MTDAGAALIWCPFADEDSASAIAGQLLDERLIACANLLPVRSLYIWNGERGEGRECAALFKTRADLLDRAVARLESLHPYDTPAISGWSCDATGTSMREWLATI
ncbi:divalent-cation tolerance protein CutA [Croceicoccus sp. Ery15]|uniref:divalent-cation tolerance protein CutA n=1 Tax=Croceicoccus sp. Ery15 TaxID=1703338 RepID=UPI001E39453A|nr:divalent-cation tolerance protein CutA [Croceicoccus sp. Ery15]